MKIPYLPLRETIALPTLHPPAIASDATQPTLHATYYMHGHATGCLSSSAPNRSAVLHVTSKLKTVWPMHFLHGSLRTSDDNGRATPLDLSLKKLSDMLSRQNLATMSR